MVILLFDLPLLGFEVIFRWVWNATVERLVLAIVWAAVLLLCMYVWSCHAHTPRGQSPQLIANHVFTWWLQEFGVAVVHRRFSVVLLAIACSRHDHAVFFFGIAINTVTACALLACLLHYFIFYLVLDLVLGALLSSLELGLLDVLVKNTIIKHFIVYSDLLKEVNYYSALLVFLDVFQVVLIQLDFLLDYWAHSRVTLLVLLLYESFMMLLWIDLFLFNLLRLILFIFYFYFFFYLWAVHYWVHVWH